jgi:hypothetical protein
MKEEYKLDNPVWYSLAETINLALITIQPVL